MTFQNVLPPAVCGTCLERPRPAIIQHQHAVWWDLILGAYAKCPECGNIFEPGTWSPDDGDEEYIEHGESKIEINYGDSMKQVEDSLKDFDASITRSMADEAAEE